MNTGICPDGHRLISRPAKYVGVPSTPIKGGIAPAPVTGRHDPGRLVWCMDRDIIGYCWGTKKYLEMAHLYDMEKEKGYAASIS